MSENNFKSSIFQITELVKKNCTDERHIELLLRESFTDLIENAIISVDPLSARRGLYSISDFRIAVGTDYTGTIIAFFAALPSLLTSLQSDWTSSSISMTISSLSAILLSILEQTVIIEDSAEWKILAHIAFLQRRGGFRSAEEIATATELDMKTVENTLSVLKSGKRTLFGKYIPLVFQFTYHDKECFKTIV